MAIDLMGLKVRGKGQTLKVKVNGRNAVGGTSILNRGQFSSMLVIGLLSMEILLLT